MRYWVLLLSIVSTAWPQAANRRAFRLEELKTQPGYEVSVYATVNGPRHMTFGPNGVLYVAARNSGSIVAIPAGGQPVTVFRGLNGVHTLEFREGSLYAGLPNGVVRLRDAVTEDLMIQGQAERLITLPTGGHNTRTVTFGPEGLMYVSVGSSCNFCIEGDDRRAAISQYDPDGGNRRLFARGLRNAVGLAWHPVTNELWATDNGGDGLGDDDPPEEVNIVRADADYGWPDCVAQKRGVRWGNQARPQRCEETATPEVESQAHSAPLGISFYTGEMFPRSFRNDALVAFHGSWNRTTPAGYKVVRIRTSEGRATGEVEDFLWGFLDTASRTQSGRPVQAIGGPDGAVYVSDDQTGNIYRVEYKGPRIAEDGIVQVDGPAYTLKGRRLSIDPGQLQLFGNGIALEVLNVGEDEVSFLLPESLRGAITIKVKNEVASDEAQIYVD
jgi:glucose/arabinose dehydrogenase